VSELEHAYNYCIELTRSHYENFPVASFALPKAMRQPISVVYAFARTADDFADEGEHTVEERFALLNDYSNKLHQTEQNEALDHPIFIAIKDVINKHQLPWQLFHDLLTAFKMDVTKKRYANFEEVLHYCRHSANPVGRLFLHLYKQATPRHLEWSDNICSALQLINFWQDIEQDFVENNRIYLPVDEMQQYGVSEEQLKNKISDNAMQQLMALQIRRTRKMLFTGAPLAYAMKGRFGLELKLTVHGGSRVLEKLEQQTSLFARPRLSKGDWLLILCRLWRSPSVSL
jgi:squalene synthase HpnC